jgi:predicted protein tyrosine phosphatase
MPRHLLFICSQNKRRSLTAEALFKHVPGYVAKSAGTEPGARTRVTVGLLGWADTIYVMERRHMDRLQAKYPEDLSEKQVINLRIPDDYGYMDEALIAVLLEKLAKELGEVGY